MNKAEEVIQALEGVLRVFERGALRAEAERTENGIECKIDYKNMAYRGVVGYNEDSGVFWKFEPDFYPDEPDEDDFLDLIFAILAEFK